MLSIALLSMPSAAEDSMRWRRGKKVDWLRASPYFFVGFDFCPFFGRPRPFD
jgi:hypothetical protein